jgi:hypothetical protein
MIRHVAEEVPEQAGGTVLHKVCKRLSSDYTSVKT